MSNADLEGFIAQWLASSADSYCQAVDEIVDASRHPSGAAQRALGTRMEARLALHARRGAHVSLRLTYGGGDLSPQAERARQLHRSLICSWAVLGAGDFAEAVDDIGDLALSSDAVVCRLRGMLDWLGKTSSQPVPRDLRERCRTEPDEHRIEVDGSELLELNAAVAIGADLARRRVPEMHGHMCAAVAGRRGRKQHLAAAEALSAEAAGTLARILGAVQCRIDQIAELHPPFEENPLVLIECLQIALESFLTVSTAGQAVTLDVDQCRGELECIPSPTIFEAMFEQPAVSRWLEANAVS